ncbi:MAG: ATP-binding cassette domain-containing protein [Chthoniobacterales bacterium]|nr:ATP-binding cassette domain-containing protein [Chthoniobacterales bacterium]
MNTPLLRCREVHCRRPLWREGPSEVRGASADFDEARFHAVAGEEGCGKNLFLHVAGLLEQPDRGEIIFAGGATSALTPAGRDELRQKNFGFVFPACVLLPSLSLLENIAFPVLKAGGSSDEEQAEHTLAALHFCGLEDVAQVSAADLTATQRAFAAFARAIIHRPRILIVESAAEEELLVPLARRAVMEWGTTVIWGAGREGAAVRAADRVLTMREGIIGE